VAYNLAGQPVYSFDQPDNLETGVLGLRSPAGMAFGPDERFYVVDANQSRVYVFPPPEVSGNVPPAVPLDVQDTAPQTGADDPNLNDGGAVDSGDSEKAPE